MKHRQNAAKAAAPAADRTPKRPPKLRSFQNAAKASPDVKAGRDERRTPQHGRRSDTGDREDKEDLPKVGGGRRRSRVAESDDGSDDGDRKQRARARRGSSSSKARQPKRRVVNFFSRDIPKLMTSLRWNPDETDDEAEKSYQGFEPIKRREEQERRARRGDTDPRYEYIFQVLSACTGLAKHQVMDHVFEENLLEEVSKFLMPGQYNNMIWFYQESEETPDVSLVEDDVNEDKIIALRNLIRFNEMKNHFGFYDA
ncbi:uncharacterized protein LOC119583361 [Penaeus monodon]|uniref:uncharacterized protein LOC119583361 n=1 Tax=Penaeus monodon TaxID=6687 RepID=UPI0018A7663C|nr:uncharacterized protein LOC119583361 [Penaeus monodon]